MDTLCPHHLRRFTTPADCTPSPLHLTFHTLNSFAFYSHSFVGSPSSPASVLAIMSKRKLSFPCDKDGSYSSDDVSSSDSDCEGVDIADALWPDEPLLNQVVAVECGARGSFDVPRGCLNKQRWAAAFTTGTTSTVSTSTCMQALAFWTSVISFRFLQAWAALIVAHRRPFEWDVPSCDRMTLTMAAMVLRRRVWLQHVLLGSAAIRFDVIVECCNMNAFSRQETQIELALGAVFSRKVSSKEELTNAAHPPRGGRSGCGGRTGWGPSPPQGQRHGL